MILPGTVTLIPLYLTFKDLGWLDTYYPLTVPAFFGGGPFNIFLLRQFVFGPLIFLTSSQKWTLALSIYQFPQMQPPGWGNQLIMCIALIVMLPVVIGFFLLQRWLIEGVNLTGVSR